jgi:WD40 repeat protein
MLAPDSLLHDRYRIIYAADERPGATIYRARDEQGGKLVLVAEFAAAPATFNDLQLLARQVAAARYDVLLPVTDHFPSGDAYYMVCDDVGGQDLERALRARGSPLLEGATLAQAQRMLGMLEDLHTQKPALFLGDPRPSDIWAREDGTWYLAPFTLVRPIGQNPSPYRAPELDQPDGEPTASSDLYALAALLYFTLTGWAPPTASQRDAGTPLNGPRALNPNLSTLAEQVLLRGLQLRPENRYQVARELRLSLEMVQMMDGRSLGSGPDVGPLITSRPPAATPPQVPQPVQPPTMPPTMPPQAQPEPPRPIYPAPAPQPYPTGIAQGQPTGNIGATTPLYPPAPPAERKRGISTGCLVALAVALTLAAVLICGGLALYLYTGGRLFGLLGGAAASAPTPAAAATSPAGAAAPTDAAPPASGTAPTAGASEPTPASASGAPGAISLASATTLTQTREITGAVLGPVAYSPDGNTLAVGISNVVSLRDAETLEDASPPRRFEGHAGQVFTLAWSPDGKLLASGAINDSTIRLWNVADGSLVRELNGHSDWIRVVTFSPDGKLLASGSIDQTVRLWDVATGAAIATLTGHTDFISSVAFTPDGEALASSSSDGTVRLWDVATTTQRPDFVYQPPPNLAGGTSLRATGLSFTPDGKTLAIGEEDGSIALVDAATGTAQRILTGHTSIVVSRGLTFSPDGKTLASASFDGTVRLWDASSGTQSAKLEGHSQRVLSLAFRPGGQQLASTSDEGGTLFVWDVKRTQEPRTFRIGQGLIRGLVFSPDGSVLGSIGFNGTIRLHLLDQARALVLLGTSPAVKPLAFLRDGRIVSITDQGTIVVLGPSDTNGTPLAGLDGQPLNVVTSNDGKLIVAGSSTGAIARWSSDGGAAMPAIRSEQLKAIYGLAISDDGSLIAAAGPPDTPRIEIWDAVSGELRQTLIAGSTLLAGLAFQPRGKLIAAADVEGKLRIWNVDDGKLVNTFSATPQQSWFSALAFSPDGSVLVTGSPNGQTIFWNAQTGEQATAVPPGDFGIFAAAFSPDGRRLALGMGDDSVRIFEVGTGS